MASRKAFLSKFHTLFKQQSLFKHSTPCKAHSHCIIIQQSNVKFGITCVAYLSHFSDTYYPLSSSRLVITFQWLKSCHYCACYGLRPSVKAVQHSIRFYATKGRRNKISEQLYLLLIYAVWMRLFLACSN